MTVSKLNSIELDDRVKNLWHINRFEEHVKICIFRKWRRSRGDSIVVR